MAKKKEVTNQDILGYYIDYFLENDRAPHSVYKFAKQYNFEEAAFYANFSSFEQIEKTFFTSLFDQTMGLLEKSEDFESYDARTKLLSFYFTYFEMLTANRSFTVALLKENKYKLKTISKLSNLRKLFKNFYMSLEIDKIDLKQDSLIEIQEKGMNELAWFQFVLTLKFWLEDTSISFEKTDIYIEKSVNTTFDLLDTKPLKSLIDFGKFIWQERSHSRM